MTGPSSSMAMVSPWMRPAMAEAMATGCSCISLSMKCS